MLVAADILSAYSGDRISRWRRPALCFHKHPVMIRPGNVLRLELNKSFSLPRVFRPETFAAEGENHRVLSLLFGKLPPLSGVVGKLIVGEDAP